MEVTPLRLRLPPIVDRAGAGNSKWRIALRSYRSFKSSSGCAAAFTLGYAFRIFPSGPIR